MASGLLPVGFLNAFVFLRDRYLPLVCSRTAGTATGIAKVAVAVSFGASMLVGDFRPRLVYGNVMLVAREDHLPPPLFVLQLTV